jgi:PAS domain S-box-containing protein
MAMVFNDNNVIYNNGFTAFFDSFPAMVWLSDITSSIIYFNKARYDFTGRLPQEETGFGWRESLHCKDADACVAAYVSAFNSRVVYGAEYRLKHKNGEYRWVRDAGWPYNGPEGDFAGYMGFCYDITEQKICEIISNDRESYYRALIENISDVITILTGNKTILYSGASTKKVVNYEPDDLIGGIYSNYIHPEDRAAFEETFDSSLLAGASPISLSYRFLSKSGDYLHLESVMTNMIQNGAVNGVIINSRDITSRIKMQQELKHAIEMADSANMAKSSFIANISHEIRTPLNSISGFVGLLADSELKPRQAEYASHIKTGCEVLVSLVNNVLDFSKIEAQKIELDETVFSISDLAEDITVLMSGAAAMNKTALSVIIDSDIKNSLAGDYKKLRQITLNLVSNAVKFTSNGSVKLTIDLESEKAGALYIKFCVIDNGIGMSREQIEKIFLPFDQSRPDISRKYGGTGLGLHISNQLVKLMGGSRITVESRENEGSSFCFILPFSSRPPEKKSLCRTGVFKLEKSVKSFDILVAEDNLINYLLVEELLKKLGHRPHRASDGCEAAELASLNKYDLIFMDIQMPVLDGYQAAQKIRTRDTIVPIIAMTANALKDDYDKCIAAGMNDYLSKPINIEKFAKIIMGIFRPDFENSPSAAIAAAAETKTPARPDESENACVTTAVDIFDRDKFFKNTFSNEILARKIIGILFEDLEKFNGVIKNAIAAKDGAGLAKSAHRLKGSAVNVCASNLKRVFIKLENAGRQGLFDEAESLIGELEDQILLFMDEIKKAGYDNVD